MAKNYPKSMTAPPQTLSVAHRVELAPINLQNLGFYLLGGGFKCWAGSHILLAAALISMALGGRLGQM